MGLSYSSPFRSELEDIMVACTYGFGADRKTHDPYTTEAVAKHVADLAFLYVRAHAFAWNEVGSVPELKSALPGMASTAPVQREHTDNGIRAVSYGDPWSDVLFFAPRVFKPIMPSDVFTLNDIIDMRLSQCHRHMVDHVENLLAAQKTIPEHLGNGGMFAASAMETSKRITFLAALLVAEDFLLRCVARKAELQSSFASSTDPEAFDIMSPLIDHMHGELRTCGFDRTAHMCRTLLVARMFFSQDVNRILNSVRSLTVTAAASPAKLDVKKDESTKMLTATFASEAGMAVTLVVEWPMLKRSANVDAAMANFTAMVAGALAKAYTDRKPEYLHAHLVAESVTAALHGACLPFLDP